MKTPRGFTYSGIHAGLKASRKDLALIASDTPCTAAGCFTTNKAKAAPIQHAISRLPGEGLRAVLVNSGHANALTGEAGLEDVHTLHQALSGALGAGPDAILSASTGVIGHRLPVQKITDALPSLVANLEADPEYAAEAIMTTDTRLKLGSRIVRIGDVDVVISAICKGSGMIHPSLASMIAIVTTDCVISPKALHLALRQAVEPSFNSLTVDGDTSTNDCVIALANGRAGNRPLVDGGPGVEEFTAALSDLCQSLAREIAADGEGATRLLEVKVTGAPTDPIARDLARSVAGSTLVKAAVFGADPNWGRILATVGARAGAEDYPVDPSASTVTVQDVVVYRGAPVAHDVDSLRGRMRSPEVKIEVELSAGPSTAIAWGCDLSYDYVKINADYSSLLVQKADGAVVRDNRLANYSPAFKTSLLVEALAYIARFEGKRCVIKYGGAAMVKESLKRSFCRDINLLRSVGLLPLVVHGGGPELHRALEKLGSKAEYVDGIRITTASDVKVVEMVLSGTINSELVTLLNEEENHAVGLSGKDAALLRAKKQFDAEGRDVGLWGEVTRVNQEFLELFLKGSYVPVISPLGIGEDGQSYNLHSDDVAAQVAIAAGATKLIYLTDVPGILRNGELITDLTAAELRAELEAGSISGGMRGKAQAILRAIDAGVQRVHVLDGRVPHSVIGELFTDRGVGTLVTA